MPRRLREAAELWRERRGRTLEYARRARGCATGSAVVRSSLEDVSTSNVAESYRCVAPARGNRVVVITAGSPGSHHGAMSVAAR